MLEIISFRPGLQDTTEQYHSEISNNKENKSQNKLRHNIRHSKREKQNHDGFKSRSKLQGPTEESIPSAMGDGCRCEKGEQQYKKGV